MFDQYPDPGDLPGPLSASYASSIHQQHVNLANAWDCTLKTCPLVEIGAIYVPTLIPNALYLAIFALLLVFHFVQSLRYKTWDIFGTMVTGLLLEIAGYAGRVRMYFEPSSKKMLTM